MAACEDLEGALVALDRVRARLKEGDDAQLATRVSSELAPVISLLENPMFCRMLRIQSSLKRLKTQLVAHPSLVPADFTVCPDSGLLQMHVSQHPDSTATPIASNSPSSSVYGAETLPRGDGYATSPHNSETDKPNPVIVPKEASSAYCQISESAEVSPPQISSAVVEAARGRQVSTVKLYKEDGVSLGFSVAGLANESNRELGIFIQSIQPGGIAARDGRLSEGDQILVIDGQTLDASISHQQAIDILQQAQGLVELVVARAPEGSLSSVSHQELAIPETAKQQEIMLNSEWAQVEVIDLVNDGTGLGFGIIGGRSTGVVVKTILAGGVADRDGRLRSGDHILQIGKHNLGGMESIQVAQVLRNAGTNVRLIVARPVDPTSPDFQVGNSSASDAPIIPTRLLSDAGELENQLKALQNGFPEPSIYGSAIEENGDSNRGIGVEHFTPLAQHDANENAVNVTGVSPSNVETYDVELVKDMGGLGITIAGYVCEREELSGIFIKSVNPGSAADLSGKVAVNDQIIEVDDSPLRGFTNYQAVEVLKGTGQIVRLKLARYISGPQYDQLQLSMSNNDSSLTHVTSDPQSQHEFTDADFPPTLTDPLVDFEAERSTTQIRVNTNPVESVYSASSIPGANHSYMEAVNRQAVLEDLDESADCEYEGVLNTDVEADIQTKWSKVLGSGYDIVVAQISKSKQGGGLGVSLEGTVDVENGEEVRPHHYIRSILADGPVGMNGRLRGGDELLEVNGQRLLGLNHMDVVNILKELPMHLRLVCGRRSIDAPLSSRESSSFAHDKFDIPGVLESAMGPLFTSERLVKAKSDGSLASSATDTSASRVRSRSMEPLSGLAMWALVPQIVVLEKSERGLGFSILDYQDPMNPNETVIVIRSLVPGGVAQMDGRLIPGDRLLFVNDVSLEHASLDSAVQALKGAPRGLVRLGVAKPLPLATDSSPSQELTIPSSHSETEVGAENVGGNSSPSASSLSSDAARGVVLEGLRFSEDA